MSKIYYRFSIENRGGAIENLDLIADEAEIALQEAIDLDVSEAEPPDLLRHLGNFLRERHADIQRMTHEGKTVEANALMLNTYRNIATYGLALGAHIK